jgi:hypothetical protein
MLLLVIFVLAEKNRIGIQILASMPDGKYYLT